jgi:hypothetical protein
MHTMANHIGSRATVSQAPHLCGPGCKDLIQLEIDDILVYKMQDIHATPAILHVACDVYQLSYLTFIWTFLLITFVLMIKLVYKFLYLGNK